MLTEYVDAALRRARYKLLSDEEGFFGEIPGFRGVWASATTLEQCRDELRDALEGWIIVRLRQDLDLPVIARLNLNGRKPRKQKVA